MGVSGLRGSPTGIPCIVELMRQRWSLPYGSWTLGKLLLHFENMLMIYSMTATASDTRRPDSFDGIMLSERAHDKQISMMFSYVLQQNAHCYYERGRTAKRILSWLRGEI